MSNGREQTIEAIRKQAESGRAWITNLLIAGDHQPDYEQSPGYQAALKFYKDFVYKEGVCYDTAVELAKWEHEKTEQTTKLLDEKADSIIKYLGGGSALLTFGALASLRADSIASCILSGVAVLSLLPSLVFAIKAVVSAIRVRTPSPNAVSPGANYGVAMAEYHKAKDAVAVNVWLLLHTLTSASQARNEHKAEWVKDAHKNYRWAVRFLLLPPVLIMIAQIVMASTLHAVPAK